jgi:hypothetical protein
VILGDEPAVEVPIQLINKGFAPAPSECLDADVDPVSTGFNGILGVGPFNEDCGTACSVSASAHAFFSCPGGATSESCEPIALPNAQQPQNVVADLPIDNNGVLLALEQVPLQGLAQISGSLVLGIDTQSNNHPQGVASYALDPYGNFTTVFQGREYADSFIDSGSNGLYFPNDVGLPVCPSGSPAAGFYCPSVVQVYTANNLSDQGSASAEIQFPVGNADDLARGDSLALVELSGPSSGGFDWGLPFFFGRAVFLGIEGKTSSLGTGRYIAY